MLGYETGFIRQKVPCRLVCDTLVVVVVFIVIIDVVIYVPILWRKLLVFRSIQLGCAVIYSSGISFRGTQRFESCYPTSEILNATMVTGSQCLRPARRQGGSTYCHWLLPCVLLASGDWKETSQALQWLDDSLKAE